MTLLQMICHHCCDTNCFLTSMKSKIVIYSHAERKAQLQSNWMALMLRVLLTDLLVTFLHVLLWPPIQLHVSRFNFPIRLCYLSWTSGSEGFQWVIVQSLSHHLIIYEMSSLNIPEVKKDVMTPCSLLSWVFL